MEKHPVVDWWGLVWFSAVIPKHAFISFMTVLILKGCGSMC